MKNLIALFVLSTLVFFTSCSKEALLESANDVEITADSAIESYVQNQESPTPLPVEAGKSNGIAVTTVSSSEIPNELTADFTSSHDFSNTNLATTQTIDFENGSGNTVTLSFEVITYTGSNGALQVTYATGGNDLTGLMMKDAQIIVEDQIIN